MAIYYNYRPNAIIRSIEVEPEKAGATSALHIASNVKIEDVRTLLGKLEGIDVLAEATVGDKVLVMIHSDQKEPELMAALKQAGEKLDPPVAGRAFDPWKMRAISSVVGQSLQLVSGLKASKNPSDGVAIAGFAVTNLVANAVNYVFGKQEKHDPNHLLALKQHFNNEYGEYVLEGKHLTAPEDNISERRQGHNKEFSKELHDMLKRNSVLFSELGLRAIGAASLSFPVTKWKSGYHLFSKGGSAAEILRVMANENPVTFKVGLLTLLGKALVGVSKEADPYNPEPTTMLDTIREKVTFPLSSLVEGSGAAWMAHDRLKNQHFTYNGKTIPDYPGALGNVVFVGSYGFRLAAPYGTLDVNMEELRAHVVDGLSKMPREKIPALLAKAAIEITEHFKDTEQSQEVADVYADLAEDLKRYHRINALEELRALKKKSEQGVSALALKDGTIKAATTPTPILNAEDIEPMFSAEQLKEHAAVASVSPS